MKKNYSCVRQVVTAVIFFSALPVREVFASEPKTKHQNSPNLFSQLTIEDLNVIHEKLEEYYPVQNRSLFVDWVDSGYSRSIEMAKRVSNLGGYTAVVRYYLNGFHHPHLRPMFLGVYSQYNWPGFLVAKKNKNYAVIYNDTSINHDFKTIDHDGNDNWRTGDGVPPVGSILIECDKRSPRQLMEQNVAPYYYNIHNPSDGDRYSPFLFLDQNNPWYNKVKTCTFKMGVKTKKFHLLWAPIPVNQLPQNKRIDNLVFGKEPDFGITPFWKNGVWISIPTFYDNKYGLLYYPESNKMDDHTDLNASKNLQTIEEQVNHFKDKDIVVFDLRGNTGGYFSYGGQFFCSLFGEEYCLNVDFGIKNNKLPIKGKVFLLTDGRCASACWKFIQFSKNFQNVVHVGRNTFSNDLCCSPDLYELPSQLSVLGIPKSCDDFFDPTLRKTNGVPFVPDYRFDGDIGDTKALKKWIISLSTKIKNNNKQT